MNARLLSPLLLLVLLSAPVTVAADAAPEKRPKMILGWLESVRLQQSGMRIKTKLDPGAKTSSMQATMSP